MRICLVAGARPNFMKIAPIIHELQARNLEEDSFVLVHTGQHYDACMSHQFFADLKIPRPDIYLGVGSATHAVQTARIMEAFESAIFSYKPDIVVVVGDVNSTMACAITAKKIGAEVAHVEAGLRSFDRSMPEEINRILTDAISDYLFVTEKSGLQNLKREGIPDDWVYFVGNTMIDTLFEQVKILNAKNPDPLIPFPYVVLTMHRPANVDDKEMLFMLLKTMEEISKSIAVVFPMHPRSKKRICEFGFENFIVQIGDFSHVEETGFYGMDPLGYRVMLNLMRGAKVLITDSGGIQEETTILGVPCITIRDNTERPITVEVGTNTVVGRAPERILSVFQDIMSGRYKKGNIPPLWDGNAAKRIVDVLLTGEIQT